MLLPSVESCSTLRTHEALDANQLVAYNLTQARKLPRLGAGEKPSPKLILSKARMPGQGVVGHERRRW